MAPSSKHLLVAAGVATVAVGAAWWLSSRRRRAPTAAAKAAKPPCCAAKAEKAAAADPPKADPPQLTEEEQAQAAARQQAVAAKERGNKRFQGRQYQLAIDEYSKAIELSPDPSHKVRVRVRVRLRALTLTLTLTPTLTLTRTLTKDVSVFYGNRAQCWACLEKYEEAERDCVSALAIDPVYVKALCRRAMAREKMGKLPEALLDLTAACMLSGFQNEMATSNTDRLIKEVAD